MEWLKMVFEGITLVLFSIALMIVFAGVMHLFVELMKWVYL